MLAVQSSSDVLEILLLPFILIFLSFLSQELMMLLRMWFVECWVIGIGCGRMQMALAADCGFYGTEKKSLLRLYMLKNILFI